MAAMVNECHGVYSQDSFLKNVADHKKPEFLSEKHVTSTNSKEWMRKKNKTVPSISLLLHIFQ